MRVRATPAHATMTVEMTAAAPWTPNEKNPCCAADALKPSRNMLSMIRAHTVDPTTRTVPTGALKVALTPLRNPVKTVPPSMATATGARHTKNTATVPTAEATAKNPYEHDRKQENRVERPGHGPETP